MKKVHVNLCLGLPRIIIYKYNNKYSFILPSIRGLHAQTHIHMNYTEIQLKATQKTQISLHHLQCSPEK